MRNHRCVLGGSPAAIRRGFAHAMALAVFVILDIEYPRLGLVRVDAFDQVLIDLRESMNRDIQSPGQK